MQSLLRSLLFASILALVSSQTIAQPLFIIELLPASSISGPAGSTVGWGYMIINNTDDYLVPTALNADIFEHGVPQALFDFPVIPPYGTASQPFIVGSAGLYQLTWNADAPLGSVNTGSFTLSSDFYDADPLSGGNYLFTADDGATIYSAEVIAASTIPEPTTALLIALGLMSLLLRRHATATQAPLLGKTSPAG